MAKNKIKYVLVNGVRMAWDDSMKKPVEIVKPSPEELEKSLVEKAKELAPEAHDIVEAPVEKKVAKKKASKKVSKKAPAKVEEGLADL